MRSCLHATGRVFLGYPSLICLNDAGKKGRPGCLLERREYLVRIIGACGISSGRCGKYNSCECLKISLYEQILEKSLIQTFCWHIFRTLPALSAKYIALRRIVHCSHQHAYYHGRLFSSERRHTRQRPGTGHAPLHQSPRGRLDYLALPALRRLRTPVQLADRGNAVAQRQLGSVTYRHEHPGAKYGSARKSAPVQLKIQTAVSRLSKYCSRSRCNNPDRDNAPSGVSCSGSSPGVCPAFRFPAPGSGARLNASNRSTLAERGAGTSTSFDSGDASVCTAATSDDWCDPITVCLSLRSRRESVWSGATVSPETDIFVSSTGA